MDLFGIGAAMRGVAGVYFQSSRQTGRTTSLLESVKNGDRIVFSEIREANRVLRLCHERGLIVECVVINPSAPGRVFEMPTPKGRTIFDHSWVEQRYILAIEQVQKEIDHLERQSSGFGEAHRETKRRALELSKWRV